VGSTSTDGQEASPERRRLPREGRPTRGDRDRDRRLAHRGRCHLVRGAGAIHDAWADDKDRPEVRSEVSAHRHRALQNLRRCDRLASRTHIRRRCRSHDRVRMLATP
jgi:hypothetical protein